MKVVKTGQSERRRRKQEGLKLAGPGKVLFAEVGRAPTTSRLRGVSARWECDIAPVVVDLAVSTAVSGSGSGSGQRWPSNVEP